MEKQPVKVKPLNKYWVVVNESGYPFKTTISAFKSVSINLAIDDFDIRKWEKLQKEGYRCIKVNIEFKPTK